MHRALAAILLGGCTVGSPFPSLDAAALPDAGFDAGHDGGEDAGPFEAGPRDAGVLDPDAACAMAAVTADVMREPVDIVWMVDNSVSMQPAIDEVTAGLNDFAALIDARDLDYRVIMLSLRGEGAGTFLGEPRYRVCIPEPLAGPGCADRAPEFHQVEIDIRSTQPLEQFLGSLGQTAGYLATDDRGSVPWQASLRPEATTTIVVVTDDNARMVVRSGGGFVAGPGLGASGDPVATADWFETTSDTADGSNPFNSNTLPEGILHPRWGGLFEGYTLSALYGWGSETDPSVACTYPGGARPPSSGPTYTELVARTGGVRARICDGPAAWGPFFDAVASAVERSSGIDCAVPIPPPPDGSFFERDRINVLVREGDVATRIGKVADAAACDARGGWYYDDEAAPTHVVLCPATCEAVQPSVGVARGVDVQFGCQTIPI